MLALTGGLWCLVSVIVNLRQSLTLSCILNMYVTGTEASTALLLSLLVVTSACLTVPSFVKKPS